MRAKPLSMLTAAMVMSIGLTACAAEDTTAASMLTDNTVDTSAGLVINGEKVADQELWNAAQGRGISFVTALSEESETKITAQFTKDTGIEVETVRLPSPKLYERVVSEQGAGKLTFDVVRLTDTTAAAEMAEQGVFAPVSTPFDEQLGKDGALAIGDGRFFSSFYALFTFVYNTQTVTGDDVPETWEDILDPAFADKLGIVNPNGSGYNTALTDTQVEHLGMGYLEKMAALSPRIFDSVAVQGPALAQGEVSVATMSLSSALGLQQVGAPVQAVLPDQAISASYTPFGITTHGADNPAAQVFVNWQMSKAGQQIVGALGLVPGRSDVGDQRAGDLVLPKPGDANFDVYTPEDQAARESDVLDSWNTLFQYAG